MSIRNRYNAAAPGGSETANSAAGTVVQFFQQAIRRRATKKRLHTAHAHMRALSAHTLRDIGVNRKELISVAGLIFEGSGLDNSFGGRANGGN